MIEADRILEPVAPDAPPIRGLREYTDERALADALRGTIAAVEHALRLLLRADRAASEQDRMRAMSAEQLPFDDLIARLRSRDRISIGLAGTIHELRRAAGTGGAAWRPGPRDADRALEVVARLRREVQAIEDAPVRAAAHQSVATHALPESASAVPVPAAARRAAGPALVALFVSLGVVALALFLVLRGGSDRMEQGIEAFRAGDLIEAAEHFRVAAEDAHDDATPHLYLGRVQRRLERYPAAREALERAARIAPEDPDVRRELGYLFMDLSAWPAAVRQFERAVELEGSESANWIGLVRAMRRAGDPRADQMLARAPADARALLAAERDTTNGTSE